MPGDVTLYYAKGACSLAAHVALEDAGAAYTPVAVDTAAGEQHRAPYLSINPKARVPALVVDGWVLTENVAILPFIGQSYPEAGLWPTDLRTQAKAAEWMGWLASTVHVAFAHVRRTERYATSAMALEDVRTKGAASCREIWRAVDERLGAGPWALGETYSVVDPYLLVFWTWSRNPALEIDPARDLPRWTDHARRMAARPSVQRVFAREGVPLPA